MNIFLKFVGFPDLVLPTYENDARQKGRTKNISNCTDSQGRAKLVHPPVSSYDISEKKV